MNAAVLHVLGEPPRSEQFAEPTPNADEVTVNVCAASLKPVEKSMAAGSHYASPRELPIICGVDGVGRLSDGTRVFFGVRRKPYGSMAQLTVVPRSLCYPVPEVLDDATAAALPNPALSSWLPLTWRARLAQGESVLVLGATGIAGKLALQISKLLGAGRVVAAGRNKEVLCTLPDLGADSLIELNLPDQELAAAFAREADRGGFNVILDFLWGRPAEILLSALARAKFASTEPGIRLLQIGDSAGPEISLKAGTLRSAGVTIMGSGGIPPLDLIKDSYQQVMRRAAAGELRIDVETVPLAEVERAWQRPSHGRRLVIIP